MAGELIRSEAICLSIVPWSRTSHVVTWLLPEGKIATVAKGAARPKSFLLGQYDLNYTCDILYYARAHGDVHALRECSPVELRESLRGNYEGLVMAGYFRWLVMEFAPQGDECIEWFNLLSKSLDGLSNTVNIRAMLFFELEVLRLMGLSPEIEAGKDGGFSLCGERRIPISEEVSMYLRDLPSDVKNLQIPLDAARVIGVFYQFHLDCASDVRRTVLGMIMKSNGGNLK